MRPGVLGATVLMALLIGLVPLVYASPPDQTWLPGLYDNADYDDVVIALTSTAAVSDGTPAPDVGPADEVTVTLRPSEPSPSEPAPRSPYRLRAPPLV